MADKKITYQGREYVVPEWAKFIATDEDGSVFVYAEHPDAEKDFGQWFPAEDYRGRQTQAERVLPVTENWSETLQEIE